MVLVGGNGDDRLADGDTQYFFCIFIYFQDDTETCRLDGWAGSSLLDRQPDLHSNSESPARAHGFCPQQRVRMRTLALLKHLR